MKKIAILGSTGSIGTQTLEIVRTNGDLEVTALAAGNNIDLLEKQIREFKPKLAAVWKEERANELKDRVEGLIGDGAEGMWIGTFHSVCMKILRRNISLLGYASDFLIYDSADQKTLIKRCLKELGMDEKTFPPKSMLAEISNAKDNLMEPDVFLAAYNGDFRMTKVGELCKLYRRARF